MTEKQRSRAKFLARVAKEHEARKPARKSRQASRAEQYGRYLDCGPQAWDSDELPTPEAR